MYTEHFRLTELPFSIAPNPRYLYLSQQHREALAHLLYGIGVGGGFVVLTGEVGTGKTTLCRALLDQLPEDVDIALIFNPRLNSRELLAGICDELHIAYPGPKASLKQLIDALNHHLLDAHARGRRVIVLIDEAQNLRFDVLEQVRLLTNLETNQTKLLQIILVGQPELNQVLERPNLRQLAQRITARYHLNPLSLAETGDYIRHRMMVAGGADRVFSRTAIRAIHRKSSGIPRLISLIADRSLLGAYTQGKDRVNGGVALRAARELFSSARAKSWLRWVALMSVLLAALAGAGYYQQGIPEPWTEFLAGLRRSHDAGRAGGQGDGGPDRAAVNEKKPVSGVAATVTEAKPSTTDAQKPPEPSSPEPSFSEWMTPPALSKTAALGRLLSAWGLQAPGDVKDPCEFAADSGLRCMSVQGSWMQLRQLNLPAVLEFSQPMGARRYAVLTGIQGEQVELTTAGGKAVFELGEVLTTWTGQGVIVWKWSGGPFKAVAPGGNAPIVGWIRQQLGVPPESTGGENVFDDVLKLKVMAFQKSRGLKPDGIIGVMTVLGLESVGNDPGIPRLDPNLH